MKTVINMDTGEVAEVAYSAADIEAAEQMASAWNDPNAVLKRQITELELLVTPRRIREAALNIDNGWLNDLDSQISSLRAQINT